jgi:ubiquinone/menaquinone biosynthesis C-methylase UbiE
MVDAGCGSGILSMTLSERYGIEIIAFDMSHVLTRAYEHNRSNLCHFVQGSVLKPPLAPQIADVTYSHGVLHHTYNTRVAFNAIAPITKRGGLLYVWLYGKKKGWNRFRFLFIRTARFFIARMPHYPQVAMVYVMATIHFGVRFIKRLLGLEKVQYQTLAQFLVSIRDKYTPLHAREHTEAEVIQWFGEAGFSNAERRVSWANTPWFIGSTDLSISGIKR